MGGKRPDQHNIAPGEAGASDYKNLPQVGKGTSSEDETTEFDRRQLAKSGRGDEPAERPAGAADTDSEKGNPAV